MTLHPEIVEFLRAGAERGLPPLSSLSAAEARAATDADARQMPPGPDLPDIHEIEIPVRDALIPARVYVPEAAHGTLVWLHGGGWVIGGLDSHDGLCRLLAESSGATVVSVAYRLAPEHPFPGPLDDCWDALRHVASSDEFEGPLALGGDSAGGNMTAVLALRARAAGPPDLAAQVLVYPVTDHEMENASYRDHGDEGTLLGRVEMEWFFGHYLPADVDRAQPEISPLRAADLSGLPAAIVVTAGHDPLRDEGLAYAARLEAAGVPVEAHHYDDMMHGFFHLATVFSGGAAGARIVGESLRTRLHEGESLRTRLHDG